MDLRFLRRKRRLQVVVLLQEKKDLTLSLRCLSRTFFWVLLCCYVAHFYIFVFSAMVDVALFGSKPIDFGSTAG